THILHIHHRPGPRVDVTLWPWNVGLTAVVLALSLALGEHLGLAHVAGVTAAKCPPHHVVADDLAAVLQIETVSHMNLLHYRCPQPMPAAASLSGQSPCSHQKSAGP